MVAQVEGFAAKLEASAITGDVDKDRAAMVAVEEGRRPLGSLLRAGRAHSGLSSVDAARPNRQCNGASPLAAEAPLCHLWSR